VSAAGRKFLAPPYYSQRAVFASLQTLFFILDLKLVVVAVLNVTQSLNNGYTSNYVYTCRKVVSLVV